MGHVMMAMMAIAFLSIARGDERISGSGVAFASSGAATGPGGRSQAVSWAGNDGALWIFGGLGVDSRGRRDVLLGDLWSWKEGTWILQGGSTEGNSRGSRASFPAARRGASAWKIGNGDAFVWGGSGYDDARVVDLSDMWLFRGNSVTAIASSSSTTTTTTTTMSWPRARRGAQTWTGVGDVLYLWGGFSTAGGHLSDMWMFNSASRTWNPVAAVGAGDKPEARSQGATWTVGDGHTLWLFGGWGATGVLNDLWSFDTVTGRWIRHGSPLLSARYGASTWVDDAQRLHLWGGFGYDHPPYAAYMSDHWVFDISSSSSSSSVVASRIESSDEGPNWSSSVCAAGGRVDASLWSANGGLYIFGGDGLAESTVGSLNDLVRIAHNGGPCKSSRQQYPNLMYGAPVMASGVEDASSASDSSGVIVGVVLGVVIACAAAITAAVVLWLRFKRNRAGAALAERGAVTLRSLAHIKASATMDPGSPSSPTPLNPSAAERNELRKQIRLSEAGGDFDE